MKTLQHSALVALIILSLFLTLYGCGKPSDTPTPPSVVNVSPCTITSDVDQALGLRNFEYDDKGLLVKMTGPNYYYGPFVRTITSTKSTDAYPTSSVDGNGNHYYGNITIVNSYTGGSGNIYDGDPEFMHQLFTGSISGSTLKTDSMFQFKYDDAKKHLTTVLIPVTGNTPGADGFTFFRYEFSFTYDANDNVTQVKIINDFMQKVATPQSGPGEIYYKQTSDELLNITYDNKPSPYTAISKYWKFIGNDFNGFGAYNLDKIHFWTGRCAILSKNNPVKITGKLITTGGTPPAEINATLSYEYNDKDFPVSVALNGSGINSFTYSCK
jgi:hypothetical protein